MQLFLLGLEQLSHDEQMWLLGQNNPLRTQPPCSRLAILCRAVHSHHIVCYMKLCSIKFVPAWRTTCAHCHCTYIICCDFSVQIVQCLLWISISATIHAFYNSSKFEFSNLIKNVGQFLVGAWFLPVNIYTAQPLAFLSFPKVGFNEDWFIMLPEASKTAVSCCVGSLYSGSGAVLTLKTSSKSFFTIFMTMCNIRQ